jgi:Fe-S-cluster containining protein
VFDIVRIARFLKVGWKSVLLGYVKIIVADVIPFLSLAGDDRGRCRFLYYRVDGTTVCTIYPARPMRCRLYPILVEQLGGGEVYVDGKCPGLNRGKPLRLPKNLYTQYIWERREHYTRLFRLVVEQGMHPLRALERVLDSAWREAESGAKWADLDYLNSLGSV